MATKLKLTDCRRCRNVPAVKKATRKDKEGWIRVECPCGCLALESSIETIEDRWNTCNKHKLKRGAYGGGKWSTAQSHETVTGLTANITADEARLIGLNLAG